MAEQKKKKGRKAYLNDFKKNQEGVYTYEGEHYVWQGTAASLKKARLFLGLLGAGMLAASLGAGCAPAPGAQNCAYVLLPYVIGLVCTINLCWKLGRLIAAGGEVALMSIRPRRRDCLSGLSWWLSSPACLWRGSWSALP